MTDPAPLFPGALYGAAMLVEWAWCIHMVLARHRRLSAKDERQWLSTMVIVQALLAFDAATQPGSHDWVVLQRGAALGAFFVMAWIGWSDFLDEWRASRCQCRSYHRRTGEHVDECPLGHR